MDFTDLRYLLVAIEAGNLRGPRSCLESSRRRSAGA